MGYRRRLKTERRRDGKTTVISYDPPGLRGSNNNFSLKKGPITFQCLMNSSNVRKIKITKWANSVKMALCKDREMDRAEFVGPSSTAEGPKISKICET